MSRLTDIPHERIDVNALEILRRLQGAGHLAYLVGGCVRDLLLARTPKDFDIATDATPQQVRSLFRNCRIIGRRFCLAHIYFGKKIIETSTFRANPPPALTELNEQVDLLVRQDNVFGTPKEDAQRRDFTINGLFYDIFAKQVIDYVDGLPDLEAGTIRSIGNADIRFQEDPVRMLRALKFSSRLNFVLDAQVQDALVRHRHRISDCATARVVEEVFRLFRGGTADQSMSLLQTSGFLAILWPKFAELSTADPEFFRIQRELLAELNCAPFSTGFSNGLLLAALAAPWLIDLMNPKSELAVRMAREDWTVVLSDQLTGLFVGLQMPRKDKDWARQLLQSQRYLFERTRWARRLQKMQDREWFEEALWLNDLLRQLNWAGRVDFPAKGEQDLALQAQAPKKRRRRRRSFRRGRNREAEPNDDSSPDLLP